MQKHSRSIIGLTAAAVLALASGMAHAQGMGQGMGGQQQPQQGGPQMEMQELQQTLAQTQQQAIENNPELERKGEELEELVLDKMEAAGFEPRSDLDTLESAEEGLRDPDLSAEERQQLIQSEDVQQAQRNLQEAQQAVAEDPEILDAQESLREDLMSAMRAENADIDDVIERMEALQQEMMQQQQPGGGGGAPGMAPQQ
ncbi:hypothetical protein [Thioalkalivibrio sp. ALgr3]|uniref:hypothetical protein n=1 Tax=Thioalkalivibrio sp. ALgr3 TaxID=1239292 RepID=UPI00036AA982|nr:hypothetical protein [Thioalkalivibrio sp. ALgr3]